MKSTEQELRAANRHMSLALNHMKMARDAEAGGLHRLSAYHTRVARKHDQESREIMRALFAEYDYSEAI